MQQKRVTIEVVARLIIIFLSTSLSSIRDDFVLFTSVSFQDRLPSRISTAAGWFRFPYRRSNWTHRDSRCIRNSYSVRNYQRPHRREQQQQQQQWEQISHHQLAIGAYSKLYYAKKKIEDRSFNIFIVIESSRPVCLADRPPFYQWRISIEKLILCFLFSYGAGKQAPNSSIDILSERASIATPLPSP